MSKTYIPSHLRQINNAFSAQDLGRVCEMHEEEFAGAYDLEKFHVPEQKAPNNAYYYKDNGSDILFVAHLDTVGMHHERQARFVDTEAGLVVFSRALDDRLGAYIGLELLPALGITYDWLLTVGEETGQSTAYYFQPAKEYNWMIEFDRGGTDVVLYQYEEGDSGEAAADLVRNSGARVGEGIFSDISYMEHLGIKGFNWGVGYRDYHGPRAHAFLEDTFSMLNRYLRFHEANAETVLPHEAFIQEKESLTWLEEEEKWWERYQLARSEETSDLWDDDDEVIDGKVVYDSAHGEDEYAQMNKQWR